MSVRSVEMEGLVPKERQYCLKDTNNVERKHVCLGEDESLHFRLIRADPDRPILRNTDGTGGTSVPVAVVIVRHVA